MAERENMSVEEILAACRADDGEGAAPAPKTEKPAAAPQPTEESAAPKSESAKSSSKKPAASSVEDILAAARTSDAGGAAPPAKDDPAAKDEKKPSPGKKPGEMSVAEMLAAARGEKSGGAPEAAKGEKAAAKPAAEKKNAPADKASPKAPAEKKKPAGPRDTQSILAAARKAEKAGPVSKAEAEAKAKENGEGPKAKAKKEPLVAPPLPEKPAYAKPQPAPARDEETRRGFFGVFLGSFLAVGFTSLGLTHLLWLLGFARFMFPNILTEPPTRFKVGSPGNFAPGMVETKYKAQFGVWVVNTVYQGVQMIFALKSVCTHLGCTPNWLEAEQKFKCPCHGSGFYKDGINFEGPAPRPLERYVIRRADDGQLEIDKSEVFQEEKGQWSNPSSFVSV